MKECRDMADAVLYFEDVDQGDEAPTRTHVLTRTDLVAYAGASGDYNPMHHDEVKATAAGQPSVFGHGMFSMGLLGTAITDYVGIGNVTRFTVRFARQTWPDEELHSAIVVTGKRTEGDRHLVDLDVRLRNAAGEEKVVGEATASVPSRG
jgi:acyl dehydratase